MSARSIFCYLFTYLLCVVPPGHTADKEVEIEYLLSFIDSSRCVFFRNGKEYESLDAAIHLRKKYKYIHKKIKTTEMFIDKVASKSSFSGMKYTVRCQDVQLTANQWLHTALTRYRRRDVQAVSQQDKL